MSKNHPDQNTIIRNKKERDKAHAVLREQQCSEQFANMSKPRQQNSTVSCLNFLARKKYFTILKKTLQKLF